MSLLRPWDLDYVFVAAKKVRKWRLRARLYAVWLLARILLSR
ncbi:hypothetical protein DKAM_0310 [Desulfurococcus amylolyticus 1221n]|uniref:Uncharacterized protein n=1 Tax=Desulfurococcus amylolyticus (strain DSM 18924 / JCM 16383 / VKM B-2413 / 1221n) TaxID=490899 RepID=B8D3F5_DESA1|nr:hypothetical protein DKAM_0310 [Desulfurococcus amylolyticus 1221n]